MGTAVLTGRRRVVVSPWTVARSARALAFGLIYASRLAPNAVRYVALLSAKPDRSSYAERGVIQSGLPYLRLRWRSGERRVYEFLLAAPMVIPRGRADVVLEQVGSDELLFDVKRPGAALVRVRWTPYWVAAGGCVERAGEWTRRWDDG